MAAVSEVGLRQEDTIDRTEAISHFIWAPTGDKLLYRTMSGKLYWSNPDGSNATLLQSYDEVDDELEEQMPMTNTLLIRSIGKEQPDGKRAPSHLDVIRFTPGQPPTITKGPDLPHAPHHLRWWSPTRASGIAHSDYTGGDLLVTVDQDGNLVDEVNVPYMISGQVRPGGGWLAYATTYQVRNPVDGSSPATAYLLNLNTGQRLQVTQAGAGDVGNWSPDGNWFLVASSSVGIAVVSADGHQWLTIPDRSATLDAVWSPDSRYLAYAVVQGNSPDGHVISSWTGKVHIIDVPLRKVTNVSDGKGDAPSSSSDLMWQPKWSRSGLVSFLSFNPGCPFFCSKLAPAIINMAPNP